LRKAAKRSILRAMALGVFAGSRIAARFFHRVWIAAALGGLVAASSGSAQSPTNPDATLAAATVVVFNQNAPGSEDLARYYAGKRAIPEQNIIGLDAPVTEEISREEYITKISAPLSAELVRRNLWIARGREVSVSRIRYAVLMRGMPLKIRSELPPPAEGEKRDPLRDRDEASVDSEMAALGVPTENRGPLNNPFFRSFSRAVDGGVPPGMLLVTRLDGPDDATVRRMIDDSLQAERRGLWGWSYVDLRGLSSGPYLQGDQWLEGTVQSMRRAGLPVLTDRMEATWPTGFPVREAAVYYGWYAGKADGPFTEEITRFMPGAIAVHIHSFSAASLRNPTAGWASPLLVRGAAATAGNVYEPYLTLTLHLDLFQERLMAGLCLADAAYAATPVLSWMAVVVGDPLYRPYAAWQRININRGGRGNEWQQFRETVVAKNNNWIVAAPYLLALSKILHNPMPALAVGVWQMDRKEYAAAVDNLRAARALTINSWQRTQIDWYLIRAFEGQGKKNEAGQVILDAFREDLPPGEQSLLAREQERLNPRPAGPGAPAPR
jgi:uncharacterized protein (TIGR03790 family)